MSVVVMKNWILRIVGVRASARCMWAGLCMALVLATSASAAHTRVELKLSANSVPPGQVQTVGFLMTMDPGWHTYWKNSGDSGIPTQIQWNLPPGFSAGPIEWPLPLKLPPASVTTYAYEGTTLLEVPITVASNVASGVYSVSAAVSWLECKDQCIPGSTNISFDLVVTNEFVPSTQFDLIQSWQSRMPETSSNWLVEASWQTTTNADQRWLVLHGQYRGPADTQPRIVDFYPYPGDIYEVETATEVKEGPGSDFTLRKMVTRFQSNWPVHVPGILVEKGIDHGWFLNPQPLGPSALVDDSNQVSSGSIQSGNLANISAPPLRFSPWRMILYALIGGLILNVMPCVLPVIALKILGFVREGGSDRRHIRLLGLAYVAGVLVSFLALASMVVGVKAAGHQAGWGMQFGSPVFVVALATLVTLVALNLFGVFEVSLGGHAMDAAGALSARRGFAGAFFNGVLATTLATPCTAPFLAPALGFAFAQGSGIIFLAFFSTGLGLALPYFLLSWQPAWISFLPKPGAWMEKFKIAMGFPMLATVIWLLYIASAAYGRGVAWVGCFLVVVSFAAWIFGAFFQHGSKARTLSLLLAFAVLILGYFGILENALHWRSGAGDVNPATTNINSPLDWKPWSPEAVTQAQASGRPVLVDFTADWCLTCQVNKKTSIEIPLVINEMKQVQGVALVADDTAFPVRITEELQRFGRAGVPLVLVYPGHPGANPLILPEILTPSLVLDALKKATQFGNDLNKSTPAAVE